MYVAPEVLRQKYNEKCDIWSAGVILYTMLCGYPPFKDKNDKGLFIKIKKGEIIFPEWSSISLDAKELIKKMLTVDFFIRPSANEVLKDSWIQKNISSNPLNKNFQSKFNTAILTFIATQLLENKEKEEISKTFQTLDKNGDGFINREELLEGLIQIYKNKTIALENLQKIENTLGFTKKDKIDYTHIILSKNKVEQAFKIIDIDGNGTISRKELENFMGGTNINENTWKTILNQKDNKLIKEVNLLITCRFHIKNLWICYCKK